MSIHNFFRKEKKMWAVYAEWRFPRSRYFSHIGNTRAVSADMAKRKMMEKRWGPRHFEIAPNITPTAVPHGSAEHLRWQEKVKNQFQGKVLKQVTAIPISRF